jgi:large subunit ribosomal protein L15
MRMNTLKPAPGARKDRVRVGRGIGSGLGKTAGRGHKGQYARTFRSRMSRDTAEVLLYQLEGIAADTVDFETLLQAKLVPSVAKRAKIVKKGDISRKITLKGIAVTAGARAAIEAAGGSISE